MSSFFFFQLTISLWVVHFSYNFCSSFIFVHLSSSTQPESVGSNPALNHKFFNEFFGIVRPKKYFFFEKKSKFFFEKKFFFPNFSNSCSLNIFEPKIWRRLGTFPSCFVFWRNWLIDSATNLAQFIRIFPNRKNNKYHLIFCRSTIMFFCKLVDYIRTKSLPRYVP